MKQFRSLVGLLLLIAALILTFQEREISNLRNRSDNSHNSKTVELIKIFDGDTVLVKDSTGQKVSVRLLEIDTPETQQNDHALRTSRRLKLSIQEQISHGKEAKRFLQSVVPPGSRLSLEFGSEQHDKYNRTLAYVRLNNGALLNEIVLRKGLAEFYPTRTESKYSKLLRNAQRAAREERLGIWADVEQ